MNSIPRRQRMLVRVAFGMVIGVLVVVCSSDQSYSQSSTRSNPGEWTSLVAPSIPVAPPMPTSTTIPVAPAIPALPGISASPAISTSPAIENSLAFNNPLKDLRQPDPSGLLEQNVPAAQVFGNTNYSSRQNRTEPILPIGWSQPGLRHRQLYFQDDQIERGNENRKFPNVIAGAKFFKSLFVFPIRLVIGN